MKNDGVQQGDEEPSQKNSCVGFTNSDALWCLRDVMLTAPPALHSTAKLASVDPRGPLTSTPTTRTEGKNFQLSTALRDLQDPSKIIERPCSEIFESSDFSQDRVFDFRFSSGSTLLTAGAGVEQESMDVVAEREKKIIRFQGRFVDVKGRQFVEILGETIGVIKGV